MDDNQRSGFIELEHTADQALRIWSDTLEGLFIHAALGMNSIAGLSIQEGERQWRSIDVHGMDDESLLVQFLSELLFLEEQENCGFDVFDITIEQNNLKGKIGCAEVDEKKREVKAITYHDMEIIRTAEGYEVIIVFDV